MSERWVERLAIGGFVAFCVAVVVGFVWLVGTGEARNDRERERWLHDPHNPVNVCIAQGGVPITSAWDGRLKRCEWSDGRVR